MQEGARHIHRGQRNLVPARHPSQVGNFAAASVVLKKFVDEGVHIGRKVTHGEGTVLVRLPVMHDAWLLVESREPLLPFCWRFHDNLPVTSRQESHALLLWRKDLVVDPHVRLILRPVRLEDLLHEDPELKASLEEVEVKCATVGEAEHLLVELPMNHRIALQCKTDDALQLLCLLGALDELRLVHRCAIVPRPAVSNVWI